MRHLLLSLAALAAVAAAPGQSQAQLVGGTLCGKTLGVGFGTSASGVGFGSGFGAPGVGFCGTPVNSSGVGFVNTGGIGLVPVTTGGIGFVNTGGIGLVNTGGIGLVPVNTGGIGLVNTGGLGFVNTGGIGMLPVNTGGVGMVPTNPGTMNGGVGGLGLTFDDVTKLKNLVNAVTNPAPAPATSTATSAALTSIANDFHIYVQIRYAEAKKAGVDLTGITPPK